MTGPKRRSLQLFCEIFEDATIRGIDEWEAATTLLVALKDDLRAWGYRRQFDYREYDKVERLPRDTHPQPIPIHIWRKLEEAQASLDSHWQDDSEKPMEWVSVDWVSGRLEAAIVDWNTLMPVHFEFSAIGVDHVRAKQILADLAGNPSKRAGRPKGPADPKERELVRSAINLIQAGDQRRDTEIAAQFADSSLTADDFERQRKRILNGIRLAQRQSENSPEK